jgi:hypothetical protein
MNERDLILEAAKRAKAEQEALEREYKLVNGRRAPDRTKT